MLIHTVCFWLRDNLSPEEREAFQMGLESLKGIASTEAVYVGTPASTEARPVIDDSYDYCLTVILTDLAAHDAYQVDPLHRDFLARFAAYWERVRIYDAD